MPVCWLGTAGILPPHIMITLLPRDAIWRRFPERKPSPKPINSNIDPTPQAMPNMVKKARSLLDQIARNTSPKMSAGDCMRLLVYTNKPGWLFPRGQGFTKGYFRCRAAMASSALGELDLR